MNRLERAISAIHVLDELAGRNTLVNKLHPLAKLGAVMYFILTVLSFDKYALSGVVAMGIYPVFLYQLADLSLCEGIKRFRTVAFLLIGLGKPYPLSRTFLREREKQQFLPEPLLLSFY